MKNHEGNEEVIKYAYYIHDNEQIINILIIKI